MVPMTLQDDPVEPTLSQGRVYQGLALALGIAILATLLAAPLLGGAGVLSGSAALAVLGVTVALLAMSQFFILSNLTRSFDGQRAIARTHFEQVEPRLEYLESTLLEVQGRVDEFDGRLASVEDAAETTRQVLSSHTTPGIAAVSAIPRRFIAPLRRAGIRTVSDLVQAHGDSLATTLDALPARVYEWQAAAQLLQVPGIDANAAQALRAAGFTTVNDLRRANADTVWSRLQRERHKGHIDLRVDRRRIEGWLKSAREQEVVHA